MLNSSLYGFVHVLDESASVSSVDSPFTYISFVCVQDTDSLCFGLEATEQSARPQGLHSIVIVGIVL